jgi:titin
MVLGNYIGTDITGKLAKANLGNGVSIGTGPGNVVGGTNAGAGNVISGNDECGVLISSSGASNNVVQGNYLGVDATGTNKLGNTLDGVQINNGASYNLVGGANGGNVISGNSSDGVFLLSGSGAGTNLVQANLIGTDSTGKKALANAGSGIAIAMEGNIIGGPSPALRNIISGNSINGIFIEGASSSNNVIEGNYIGPDITGVDPIGNGGEGIYITNAPANTIGGIGDDAGNVIGANNATGVVLYANTSGTVIQGNYIGTDSTGNNAMPNFGGIYLYGSSSNVIGGTDLGAGNIISGNSFEGIALNSPTNNGSWAGPGANSNAIQGNLIGTKANGFSPLGNQQHNIDFYTNANNNLVGGTGIYTPNNIAFATTAGYDGVRVRVGCVGNSIIQNSIFSNAGFGIVIGNYVAGQVNTSNMVTLTSVVSESITNTNTVPLPKPSSSRVFGPPYNGLPTNFTTIQGTMSTHAGSSFLVQFYENRTPNVSVLPGYGEGLYYLGSTNITTGSNGKASFTLTLPVYVPAGWYVSATATDSSNTTWEFGPDFKVTSSVVVPGVQLLSNPSFSISQSPAGVAPPAISIGWIANPTDYLLMQTSDLTPPVNWSPATGFVTASGTTNTFTTTPSGPSMFYMLLAQ